MEDKQKKDGRSFGDRAEAFFAGKGFYIVLVLCVAVIGVSAWSMLSGGGKQAGAGVNETLPVSGRADAAIVTGRTNPRVVPETSAAPTPRPTAAPRTQELPAGKPAETAPVPAPTETPKAETVAPAPEPATAETAAAPYFIWPVSGEVENGYSMSALVFNRTMRDWRTHDGVDIAAELGTQVRAAANGKVKNVYYDERLGTTVVLDHGGGVESLYANLAATPAVSVGDQVGVGQVIGAVGDTALFEVAEVSHLHFAMTRDGQSADPGEFLPQNG